MSILIDLINKIPVEIRDDLIRCHQVSERLGIRFVLVGATARDLVMYYGYGAKLRSLTNDIDIGILVESWDQYNELRDGLIADGYRASRVIHRLFSPQDIKTDFVPFGKIQNNNDIAFPPPGEMVMNVLGFSEAFEHAVPVLINHDPKVAIRVASPVGITILKLIAWVDREDADKKRKDAQDFVYLLKESEKIFPDQVFDSEELLARYDGNTTLIGAFILGQRAGSISSQDTHSFISDIFNEKMKGYSVEKLIKDSMEGQDFEECQKLIQSYWDGFSEKLK